MMGNCHAEFFFSLNLLRSRIFLHCTYTLSRRKVTQNSDAWAIYQVTEVKTLLIFHLFLAPFADSHRTQPISCHRERSGRWLRLSWTTCVLFGIWKFPSLGEFSCRRHQLQVGSTWEDFLHSLWGAPSRVCVARVWKIQKLLATAVAWVCETGAL